MRSAQMLCNLLNISMAEFFEKAQEYALPYLVLEHRRNDIRKIAEILKKNTAELCFLYLQAILAALLSSGLGDPILESKAYLTEISEKLSRLNIAKYVQINSLIISVEVLKMYSDSDDQIPEEKVSVFRTIRFLADVDSQIESTSGSNANLDKFISKNILGIMCHFSDMLYKKPFWPDRRRYLRGLSSTIRLARHHAVTATPQICSSLQATIGDRNLQDVVIGAWINMMRYFPKGDAAKLIPLVLSVMFNSWDKFTNLAKARATELLEYILTAYRDHLGKMRISTIPTTIYVSHQIQSVIDRFLELLLPCADLKLMLNDMSSRCRHENFAVVHEALLELRTMLLQKQSLLQDLALESSSESVISEVSRDLTGVCHRFSERRPDITKVAVECIGLIGSIGYTKIVASDNPQDFILVSNFMKSKENTDYIALFLDNFLVPAFQSSTDTKSQLFLAFAMQQLLATCGLNTSTIKPSHLQQYTTWGAFSEAAKVTLTPFLSSRYELGHRQGHELSFEEYPLFSTAKDHKAWVQNFARDLLCRASVHWRKLWEAENGSISVTENIFFIFSKIINNQDVRLAEFLLPSVYQFLVCHGTESERGYILEELLIVLNVESNSNEVKRDDIRLSYQVCFN